MSSALTLFIVEGQDRDWRFVRQMAKTFLKGRFETVVLSLPAAQNIYMLYEKLAEDDFDTDVVEVLRESVPAARDVLEGVSRDEIEQVYLFFDYDPHQDNLPDGGDGVLARMLEVFDNETENGKLYVSYPMVEALYDYRRGGCDAYSGCYVALEEAGRYKRAAGDGNPNASSHMGIDSWNEVLEVYPVRLSCLMQDDGLVDFEGYRGRVTSEAILRAQRRLAGETDCIFALSAFPQFLYDYFPRSFWLSHAKMRVRKFDRCPKEARRG